MQGTVAIFKASNYTQGQLVFTDKYQMIIDKHETYLISVSLMSGP